MIKLSPNFTLEELTASSLVPDQTAPREVKEKLFYLAQFILQPIRDQWGRVQVTSGYRGHRLNRLVGGSETSQHLTGEAADIVPLDSPFNAVFDWIVRTRVFGQAIWEVKASGQEWLHLSLPRLNKPNQQALIFDGVDYKVFAG